MLSLKNYRQNKQTNIQEIWWTSASAWKRVLRKGWMEAAKGWIRVIDGCKLTAQFCWRSHRDSSLPKIILSFRPKPKSFILHKLQSLVIECQVNHLTQVPFPLSHKAFYDRSPLTLRVKASEFCYLLELEYSALPHPLVLLHYHKLSVIQLFHCLSLAVLELTL